MKKLETLFSELDYTVRYEKGSFQSGYCIVENRKVAVVNKFFDTESRINVLLEVLGVIDYTEEKLSEKSIKLLKGIRNNSLTDENEEEPSN
ncbi:MAG TPA: hypothetical protein PLC89_03655 [Haliscomenobacter sp.]|uniref:hypothetical protein n=1 Tax=Haliscomenobacter sp. TaxID=2717303 RepID=UPI0025C488F4|nr:hypothetical protein [Haliscomenobacter sp.]HOY16358.1 hypothetical protein [Haliscomenobacter sp.]HPH17179.1 hypothetical protein [Haliscomenobacter sp.]